MAGLLADRFSKRWLVIGSLAIWSVVTTLTGLGNSLMALLVLRVAMGISESMFMPAAISLTANAHAPHQRSRAIAILTTGQIVGTLVGGSFGGWMAGIGQWRMAFFILGAIGLLYVIPYALFLNTAARSCDTNPTDGAATEPVAAPASTYADAAAPRPALRRCTYFCVLYFQYSYSVYGRSMRGCPPLCITSLT